MLLQFTRRHEGDRQARPTAHETDGIQMVTKVLRSSLRAGLVLRHENSTLLFSRCEVVRVTNHTVTVRCRTGNGRWSNDFLCRSRGVSRHDRDTGVEDAFFVLGFGWLHVFPDA